MGKSEFDETLKKYIDDERLDYQRCMQRDQVSEAFIHGTCIQKLLNLQNIKAKEKAPEPVIKTVTVDKPIEIIKEVKTPVEVIKYVKVPTAAPANVSPKTAIIGFGMLYLLAKAAAGSGK